MLQPRTNPAARVQGPFLGLNTVTDPSQLDPRAATVARNVLLREGRARPMPPWTGLGAFGDRPQVLEPGDRVVAMHQLDRSATGQPVVIAKVRKAQSQGLFVFDQVNPGRGAPLQLPGIYTDKPCGFLEIGHWLYVFDGPVGVYKTRGTPQTTFKAGVNAMPPDELLAANTITQNPFDMSGTYQWWATWMSSDRKVEGNAVHLATKTLGANQIVQFFFRGNHGQTGQDIGYIRLYRRNVTAEQIAARLIAETPVVDPGGGSATIIDNLLEANISLSSDVTGPFAPTRNAPPWPCTVGWWLKSRLWTNDEANPAILRWSAAGEPEHFADLDQQLLAGNRNERVGGLISLGDTLFVGKQHGIQTVSGDPNGHTNLTIATGTAPLDSTLTLEESRCAVGPSNRWGNGFVRAGTPSRLYFGNPSGFYAFDGVEALPLSIGVEPTWSRLANRPDMGDGSGGRDFALSYADVPSLGVLLVCQSGVQPDDDVFGMALHYHAQNGWSTFDGDYELDRDQFERRDAHVLCVASGTLGLQAGPTVNRALALLGTSTGLVLAMDDTPHAAAAVAPFEYETGNLMRLIGFRAHVYAIKWLFAGPFAPVTDAAVVRVSVLADGQLVAVHDVDLSSHKSFRQSVRRACADLRLRVERGPTWKAGWRPEYGLIGFEPDLELVGAS